MKRNKLPPGRFDPGDRRIVDGLYLLRDDMLEAGRSYAAGYPVNPLFIALARLRIADEERARTPDQRGVK